MNNRKDKIMIHDLFDNFIEYSAKLRSGYPDSLGSSFREWENIVIRITPEIPAICKAIYSKVSGTMRSIETQSLMDFIPGYRLIHIQELESEKISLEGILQYEDEIEELTLLPILANYSSCYICYGRDESGSEKIYMVTPEDEPEVMYESPEKFLETICECYKQNIYFLDQDGYLDCDFDKLYELNI